MHKEVSPRARIRASRLAALTLLLALAAPTVHAAPRATVGPEGAGKLLAYFSCAWSVALAYDTVSWIGAMTGCLRTLYDELPEDRP